MGLKVPGSSLDHLLSRLNKGSPLCAELRAALRGSLLRSELHPKEALLEAGPERARAARMIVRGWAAQYRAMADGKRQIFNILVPGDILFGERPNPLPSQSIVALTVVETVEIGAICAVADRPDVSKALSAACAAEAVMQASLLFDHIVRLGQQNAAERMVDLFLELHRRLSLVGLGRADGFDLPLKQEHLAESLGLTLVHTNRTLQKLRSQGLLHFRDGKVRLINMRGLSRLVSYGEYAGPDSAEEPGDSSTKPAAA